MTRPPLHEAAESDAERARNGLAAGLTAYLLWGILPVYFKLVQAVPATEVLAHRIVWAVPFGALIIAWRRQWPEVGRAVSNRGTFGLLTLGSAIIAGNWFMYIYAVQQDHVFQASLGYYINPLTNMLAGVVFFSERLRRRQSAAVLLAAIGVSVLAMSGAAFPWISIALALSFTAYGIIRKRVAVGGMPGLFIETLLLLPFALVYLGWLVTTSGAVFGRGDAATDGLLLLAGPITVVPLLLFALAARRLQLTTIGILQFIAPTLQFVIAVAYGEALTRAHLVCFICIWTAISLFALDAWQQSRRIQALRAPAPQ